MGLGTERHDLHSYETQDGQWIGFRQPVLRAARERDGETVTDTREANPGEVWEENEFWIELSWRIDPDGALGIRRFFESKAHAGHEALGRRVLRLDLRELGARPAGEGRGGQGSTPLAYMRRYGAFEVAKDVGRLFEVAVPASELVDVAEDRFGRVFTRSPAAAARSTSRRPARRRATPTAAGRSACASTARSCAASRPRRASSSSTRRRSRSGAGPRCALPGYIQSHVHPSRLEPRADAADLDLPPADADPHPQRQRQVARRDRAHQSALDPPERRARLGVATGDLVRVETEIGHFVVKAWVTEGIRPGVVACSHHMGRWKLGNGTGQNRANAR